MPTEVLPGPPAIVAIIPVYNGAKYIERAILSVLAQTVQPAEFLVIDDGSTDDSREVIQRLAAEHPLVRLVTKENGGQSSARNLGVKSSSSPLIAFLDQDDAWYQNHLEKLSEPFQTGNLRLGWVYSDMDQVDKNWMMVRRDMLRTIPIQHPKRDLSVCLKEDMFILPSASLISRDAFEASGGFDERLSGYEDDDLFLRLFRLGYDNIFIPQALSAWRIFTGSTSYTDRMARSRIIYMNKLIEAFPDEPDMNLFWCRDCIAPRFRKNLFSEYLRGIRTGNRKLAEASIEDVSKLIGYMRFKQRVAFSALMPLMSNYGLARLAYRLNLYTIARRLLRGAY